MTKIVVDASLKNQLKCFVQPVELCDGSGQVLGSFWPLLDPSQYEPLEPQVSEEELRRREQSTEWYSTDEVLARLEKL